MNSIKNNQWHPRYILSYILITSTLLPSYSSLLATGIQIKLYGLQIIYYYNL